MAAEFETEAAARLAADERKAKVTALLNSGHAYVVLELALAAYWDHLQAKDRAEQIERELVIDSTTDRLSGIEAAQRRAQKDRANDAADAHFRAAADLSAIAGAVALAQLAQRPPEAQS